MRLEQFCRCGHHAIVDKPMDLQCPLCGQVLHIEIPRWVRVVQRLSKPEDVGLGATIKRIAAKVGGERFKAWSKRIRFPCGCTEREKYLNIAYPNPRYSNQ